MAGQIVKRGERKYLIRVSLGRDKGTGKRKHLDKTVHGSKREAEAELTRLLRERDTGALIMPSKQSLDNYLDTWLETVAKARVRESTFEDYKRVLAYYIRPELGETQLQRLFAPDIQAAYSRLTARDLSARTVRYAHGVLRDALGHAVQWRLLQTNPCDYVDLPRKEQNEMRCMSEEESHKFLEAARSARHFALFALLLSTGLRPSEALALKWADIDLREHSLKVQRKLTRPVGGSFKFEEPKTKQGRRTVDYPASLTEILLAHQAAQAEKLGPRRPSDLVFCGKTGDPLDERNVLKRHFRPALMAAGLHAKTRLYDLRHTHATMLLASGTFAKVVSERLGHASVAFTLSVYGHVLPNMQRATADRLDGMLFGREQEEAEPRPLN